MSTTKPHGMYRHHCPTCGAFFQARNFNRHRKACLRRKREPSDIQWGPLQYPGGDPENGPARRVPINGCTKCGDTNADEYNAHGHGTCCDQFNDGSAKQCQTCTITFCWEYYGIQAMIAARLDFHSAFP